MCLISILCVCLISILLCIRDLSKYQFHNCPLSFKGSSLRLRTFAPGLCEENERKHSYGGMLPKTLYEVFGERSRFAFFTFIIIFKFFHLAVWPLKLNSAVFNSPGRNWTSGSDLEWPRIPVGVPVFMVAAPVPWLGPGRAGESLAPNKNQFPPLLCVTGFLCESKHFSLSENICLSGIFFPSAEWQRPCLFVLTLKLLLT